MCWEECAMISHWLYGTSWRLIKLIGIPVKGATACRLPLGDCHTRRVCILQVKDVHSLDWLLFSLFVNRLAHRQPGNQAVISYATHKGWMWIEKTKRETVYWRSPQCCFCFVRIHGRQCLYFPLPSTVPYCTLPLDELWSFFILTPWRVVIMFALKTHTAPLLFPLYHL